MIGSLQILNSEIKYRLKHKRQSVSQEDAKNTTTRIILYPFL